MIENGTERARFKFCPWCGTKYSETSSECGQCHRPRSVMPKPGEESAVQWRKVLYEHQPVDDNYVDKTFLECLETDEEYKKIKYGDIVYKAMEVSFNFSVLIVIISIFDSLQTGKTNAMTLLLIETIAAVVAILVFFVLTPRIFSLRDALSYIKSGVTVISVGFFMSPMYKSFNADFANDTVYVLVFVLSMVHLLLYNYSYVETEKITVEINTSILIMIFVSILLGTRLSNDFEVFAFLMMTILFYLFMPVLRKSIRLFQKSWHVYFLLICFTILVWALFRKSKVQALMYVLSILFINFVCPLWLMWLYQYKNVVKGPWDLPAVKSYD